MCYIGWVVSCNREWHKVKKQMLNSMLERWRDAFGSVIDWKFYKSLSFESFCDVVAWQTISNYWLFISRAEPTTERVKEKTAENNQPFWQLVHNWTIANDKELAKKYWVNMQSNIDSSVLYDILNKFSWIDEIINFLKNEVIWSFAMAFKRKNYVIVANNYRPIYYFAWWWEVIFWSTKDFLQSKFCRKLPNYSILIIDTDGWDYTEVVWCLYKPSKEKKWLVMFSAGLDSTTVSKMAVDDCDEVRLVHFNYWCNATSKEYECAKNIEQRYQSKNKNVDCIFPDVSDYFKSIQDSWIMNNKYSPKLWNEWIEFAFEWVYARNTYFMAWLFWYAEANWYNRIYSWINLEEAWAYPDNEVDYFDQRNSFSWNVVWAWKQIEVISPIGRLMKHEIVKKAYDIGAPIHLSRSCYKWDEKHCWQCWPCRMRKIWHKINWLEDCIFYSF